MKKEIVFALHAAYWLLYGLLIALLLLALPGAHKPPFARAVLAPQLLFTIVLPAVAGFYGFQNPVFAALRQRKIAASLARALALVAGIALLFLALIRLAGPSSLLPGTEGGVIGLLVISGIAFLHGSIGLVIKGFQTWYGEIRLREELQRRQTETELQLIRAKLHPHFLFNTINNIDVLIQKDADQASRYLLTLSDLLRYALYEAGDGTVPLAQELESIRKYLSLQALRTAREDSIHYVVHGDAGGVTVEPMLFMPFIENAFKHTPDLRAKDAVRIEFSIGKGAISFLCENRYGRRPAQPEAGGVGVDLIRRRLQLLYPGRHRLELADAGGIYRVNLQLNHAH